MALFTADTIAEAVAILRASKTCRQAREEMQRRWGRVVSESTLTHRFAAMGAGLPSSYLNGGRGPGRWVSEAVDDSVVDSGACVGYSTGGVDVDLSGLDLPAPPTDDIERILIVPDAHHPYHDRKAWGLMLKAGRVFRPDRVVCLGDLVDFYAVSFHPKDPNRKRNLEFEIQAGCKALDDMASLGASRLDYVLGNHEDRLNRYLTSNAPELYNLVRLEEAMGLERRGWKVTQYRDHLTVGKMHFTHETGDAGMYAHVRARAAFSANACIGHTHRMATHYAGNAHGTSHVGAMFGHLLDVSTVDYMHRIRAHAWQLGFGLGYHERSTGVVHLVPVPIIEYRCLVEGRLIRWTKDDQQAEAA